MDNISEKRKDRRLDLRLGLEFAPQCGNGATVTHAGETCNVSAGGVYFKTAKSNPIERGRDILLKIAIPRPKDCDSEPLALRCVGKIIRIEHLAAAPDSGDIGVAVQFNDRPNVEFHSLGNLLWDLGV